MEKRGRSDAVGKRISDFNKARAVMGKRSRSQFNKARALMGKRTSSNFNKMRALMG